MWISYIAIVIGKIGASQTALSLSLSQFHQFLGRFLWDFLGVVRWTWTNYNVRNHTHIDSQIWCIFAHSENAFQTGSIDKSTLNIFTPIAGLSHSSGLHLCERMQRRTLLIFPCTELSHTTTVYVVEETEQQQQKNDEKFIRCTQNCSTFYSYNAPFLFSLTRFPLVFVCICSVLVSIFFTVK